MTQMREQSRQIITLINVVTQLVSFIAKFKRKLIVVFSFSEEFTFTNTQHVSSKRIVKLTKRAQTIRIEIVRVKKAKIHEDSIEFLIFLIFETTRLKKRDALFVNKHVSLQSNDVDSFTNVLSFENLNISNQSSFESQIVEKFEIIYDSVDAFFSVFVFVFEIEFNAAHQ
jgi:hypothetical protein